MRTLDATVGLLMFCSFAALPGCGGTTSNPSGSSSAGASSSAAGTSSSAAGTSSQAGANAASGAPGAGGAPSSSGGMSSGTAGAGAMSTGGSSGGGNAECGAPETTPAPAPSGTTSLGKFVLTWYSFQDNTPVNSRLSASGNTLIPYVSVAVPFTKIAGCSGNTPPPGKTCGTLNYGDKLYVDFLKDRVMPNGMKHSGWVELDDYCGDDGDDSYCFQDIGDGNMYPNTDLYIGDFVQSGMAPCGDSCAGPAGDGNELFNLSTGNPGTGFLSDYGGGAVGTAKCGDRQAARDQQFGPPAGSPFGTASKDGSMTGCWGYDSQGSNTHACNDCVAGVTCAK